MSYHNQFQISSAFSQFHAQVNELCESSLGQKVLEDRAYQSSTHARSLSDALNRLKDSVREIHSRYGSRGPDTAWNPILSRETSPFPSPQRQISDLQSENKGLKNTINIREVELQNADQKLDKSCSEITEANMTIESLRQLLVSEYKTHNSLDLAAEQLDFLSKMKDKERQEKISKKDKTGARFAEDLQLRYMHQRGEILLESGRFAEAEATVRHVLERGKKLHQDDRVKRQESREAQLQLCTALRAQKLEIKSKEAEELYYGGSLLTRLDDQNEADRTWAIRNAFGLAFVDAEQGSYSNAIDQLRRVWPCRNKASPECKTYLNTEIVRLWRLLDQRQQTVHAGELLTIISGKHQGLPINFLPKLSQRGKLLYKQGEYKKATTYLGKALAIPSLPSNEKLELGWLYGQSLCHLKNFSEAKKTLSTMRSSSRHDTSPSEHTIKALLAYIHLRLNELTESEKLARALFSHYGTSSVPGSQTYNHADTLICALAQYDTKVQYESACSIWNQIYTNRNRIHLDSKGKEQIRCHAQTGKELGAKWRNNAIRRGVSKPKRPGEINSQAEALERMAA